MLHCDNLRPARVPTKDVPMKQPHSPTPVTVATAHERAELARHGLYDPTARARRLRRRLRRPHQGHQGARDHRAGPEDPGEPRPSRRGRRRQADGRRRRHPDPDPRRAATAPRWPHRASSLPPPGEYGVGMIFLPKEHASRLACEQELERAVKARGPGAARLARRAGRPRDADVADGARQGAGDPPGLHRPRPGRDRARRARAQAVRDPQDRVARDPGAEADAQPRVLRASA